MSCVLHHFAKLDERPGPYVRAGIAQIADHILSRVMADLVGLEGVELTSAKAVNSFEIVVLRFGSGNELLIHPMKTRRQYLDLLD